MNDISFAISIAVLTSASNRYSIGSRVPF